MKREATSVALCLLGLFAVPSAILTHMAAPESFIGGFGVFAAVYILCAAFGLSVLFLIEIFLIEGGLNVHY